MPNIQDGNISCYPEQDNRKLEMVDDVRNAKTINYENMLRNYEEIYQKRFGSRALLSRLGTVLLHFSRRSTIHGLNHLAQARSAKHRLFWLTISCCASLGFCVNLFYLIEKFLQTPVLTNVFHDYNNFTYPDLTFCIVNPIYFPPNLTRNFNQLVSVIKEFDDLTNRSRVKYSEFGNNSFSHKIELSDYLFMHKKLEYSHQSWSAIVLCRYLKKECNYTHFETRHIWPYGNCFTFNGTKMGPEGTRDVKQNTFLNGWRPDFKIVIYKALEYPPSLQLDPFNDINKPSGVLVMIHEADTYPHIGESFVVDSFTQVDLKITTKSHLSTVKKCKSKRSSYTYYDFKTNSSTTFFGRQGDCLFSIIQTNIAKYCGCQIHKMPVLAKHRDLPFCFDMNFINRHSNLSKCLHISLDDVDKREIRHMCYKDMCEHPSFTTVVSHSKYPAVGERQTHMLWLKNLKSLESREIENFGRSELFKLAIYPSNQSRPHPFKFIGEVLKAGRTDLLREQFINKNFMHLRFVPSSLFMDHVEETEEYPLSRLLSDIGGCVGLWVGASLITVFEFIDLLLDFGEIIRYRAQAASAFRKQAMRYTVELQEQQQQLQQLHYHHHHHQHQQQQQQHQSADTASPKSPKKCGSNYVFTGSPEHLDMQRMPNAIQSRYSCDKTGQFSMAPQFGDYFKNSDRSAVLKNPSINDDSNISNSDNNINNINKNKHTSPSKTIKSLSNKYSAPYWHNSDSKHKHKWGSHINNNNNNNNDNDDDDGKDVAAGDDNHNNLSKTTESSPPISRSISSSISSNASQASSPSSSSSQFDSRVYFAQTDIVMSV